MALKLGDRVLITLGIAALIVGGVWFAVQHGASQAGSNTQQLVVVCQSRDGFYRADALASEVEYTVTTTGADGEQGENVVRISNGSVDVVSATCANQICVEHDPISQPGEEIVCLPHGVVIGVVADEADAPALVS